MRAWGGEFRELGMIGVLMFLGSIFGVSGMGSKIKSENCGLLMFIDGMMYKDMPRSMVPTTEGDPCVLVDGVATVTLTTTGTDESEADTRQLVMEIMKGSMSYELTSLTYNDDPFKPFEQGTVGYNPGASIGEGWTCTTLSFIASPVEVDIVPDTINFKQFAFQMNTEEGTFEDFTDVNHCTGIVNTETMMIILTLLFMFCIGAFGMMMLMGIDTMDKFESPKDRPFQISLDAKSK